MSAARKRLPREPETAVIDGVTHDGRGIAAVDGKKVFVDGALAGETVRFRRRRSKRRFDEAELVEVIEPSPDRVEPRCEVFGLCGGCSLQHVSPETQRDIKFRTLKDNLERIGGVSPGEWLPPLTGSEWQYRRRARLAVKDVAGKGRVLVGFRERHAPYVTDMHRCEVLVEPLGGLVDALSELIGTLSIRARIPQVEVAAGDNATALVFRVLDPPGETDREALAAFARRHGLRVYLQTGGTDTVACLEPSGVDEPLYYELPGFGVRIAFEPVDFVQINAGINRRMVAAAIDLLAPQAGDRILDLYCGIGNFSLPLARRAAHVTGIEGDASLVKRAAENARANAIPNAEFVCADLSAVDGSEPWMRQDCDRLLLDPSRNGAAEVIEHVGRMRPGRIVYVSCHPGTLARDAGRLVEAHGYRLEAAGIIDMFPHTAHVESVAVFGAPERRPGA